MSQPPPTLAPPPIMSSSTDQHDKHLQQLEPKPSSPPSSSLTPLPSIKEKTQINPNIISWIFMFWMDKFMWIGYKKVLEVDVSILPVAGG
jgi:hypothetical protein